MIIFKFSPETTTEQIDECIHRLQDLKNHVPGIIDIVAGHNFSSRSQGYELGLTVRFENRAALDAYGPHPKHQECVQFMASVGRQDAIAVDFEF
jgi:hypothetical protein